MTEDRLVYIVDDDSEVRDFLRALLDERGYLVRVFANGNAVLKAFDARQVQCVVLDVRLPDIDGLEVLRVLTRTGPEVPVIAITAFGDVSMAVLAMKCGAFDFLEKGVGPDQILDRIQDAIAAYGDARERKSLTDPINKRIETLTRREREVFHHIVEGMTSNDIAKSLDISRRTVETHRSRIMEKMNAKNSSHLVSMAHIVHPASGSFNPGWVEEKTDTRVSSDGKSDSQYIHRRTAAIIEKIRDS